MRRKQKFYLRHYKVFLPEVGDAMIEFGYTLTNEQNEAVEKLVGGSDVVALMPTGSGKSIIFQSIAVALKKRQAGGKMVVITPLNNISYMHVKTLEKVIC